jgi:two-component system chemotaxis response regulator CheY
MDSRVRILIVDDSHVIRRGIERTIRDKEYEIRTAGNGHEALRVFSEFRPQVVTMDLTMPEMDGISCVDAIMLKDPEARVLVITALADKGTIVEVLKRGAQSFLLKPFTPEHLLLELSSLFDPF